MRILFVLFSLCLTNFFINDASAQEEYGVASYYSDAFHGRKTASNETYDKNKLTAAHKLLPYGTILKVTRLDNKASIRVRVNDRGPYIKGRIVELSRKAAERIGIIRDGHAEVKIEVVGKAKTEDLEDVAPVAAKPSDFQEASPTKRPKVDEYSEELVVDNTPKYKPINIEIGKEDSEPEVKEKKKPAVKKKAEVKKEAAVKREAVAKKVSEPIVPPPAKALPQVPSMPMAKGSDYKDFDLYKIQLLRPAKSGFGVQVASMTNYDNVLKQVASLQEQWFKNILLSIEPGKDGKPVYKIILGPFGDQETAKAYKKQLKKKKKMASFVVDLAGIKY